MALSEVGTDASSLGIAGLTCGKLKVHTGFMNRYLPFLFSSLLLASSAWGQAASSEPTNERAAVMGRCAEAVTTTCLVESIRTYLVPGQDQFSRERVMQALANAQLSDGKVEQAMASYRELSANTGKAQFLTSYAKIQMLQGDKARALETLREADSLLTSKEANLTRLDATGQSEKIAQAFADAGSPEKGRAILAEIADYRRRVPMNPMLLALMVQVAKSQAAIGFEDEAALYLRESFDRALQRGVNLMPEQVFQIFEAWAAIDPEAANSTAKDLIKVVGEDGPSVFEFAIWTGLAAGLSSSEDRTAAIANARRSMADAPERAFALQLVPKLAEVLRQHGKADEARALLDNAAAEASALTPPLDKAQTLLPLAEAFTRAEESAKSEKLLNEILALDGEPGPQGLALKHFVSAVPAQLALLGKSDIAYDLVMKTEEGRRDMALIMAANKLAVKGDYREAMRFLSQLKGEISAMMMAGIAQRLAGINDNAASP